MDQPPPARPRKPLVVRGDHNTIATTEEGDVLIRPGPIGPPEGEGLPCPRCKHPNWADAARCRHCDLDFHRTRRRLVKLAQLLLLAVCALMLCLIALRPDP